MWRSVRTILFVPYIGLSGFFLFKNSIHIILPEKIYFGLAALYLPC